MLEAEMDVKLGYSKYDYKSKETDDSRYGYSPKTVTSSMGLSDLDIPRNRKVEFKPRIVKKNQADIFDIENQVLPMYAKDMTTRDISTYLYDVYGVDVSAKMVSHMTDRYSVHCERMAELASGMQICHCIHGRRPFPGREPHSKKGCLYCNWYSP